MCEGLVRSYGGMLAIRFLLGIFEASLPSGAAYMLSAYYTKHEASPRFAWFFSFALGGSMFSGLLAYAIENLNGQGGLEGWRWIFIIEGLMAVGMSGLIILLLPDVPQKAPRWFLRDRERLYPLQKLEASRDKEQSAADDVSMWKVLTNWRIHVFTICFFCCDITASSLAGFSPTILTQLGWVSSKAQLMTMPIWAAGILASISVTMLASRLDLRFPFILGCVSLQMFGWIIMRVYVPEVRVRYAALFLMSMGTFPQMPILMGWLSANLKGRKVCVSHINFGNCNLGWLGVCDD